MMKQILTVLLIICSLWSLKSQDYGYINDSDGYTNIRLEASDKSEISGIILAGQEFLYYQTDSTSWWQIDFQNRTGFIHNSRILNFETKRLEIEDFFIAFFKTNRNNAEYSATYNEKLFLFAQDYPKALIQSFVMQNKEVKSFLISEFKSPIHDLLDIQLIYSRLKATNEPKQDYEPILESLKKAANGLGQTFIESDIDFNKIPEYNKPNEKLWGVNKKFTSIIAGKSIIYYLNHPKIDRFSKMYYQGQFRLYDNSKTFAFLDSVMTLNNETKPFYFFIFNSVLSQSDGALSEYISGNCMDYFKTNPCDYFEFASTKEFYIANAKWTSFIGWYLHTKSNYDPFKKLIENRIKNDCSDYLNSWAIFSNDIYKNLETK